jgi:hypothetical protein
MPMRNLQDTPDKFGPVVDPFSGGSPSHTWALPTPPGKTILYNYMSERALDFIYEHTFTILNRYVVPNSPICCYIICYLKNIK